MGLGTYLFLFDEARFTAEIVPAYSSFLDNGATDRLRALLRKTIDDGFPWSEVTNERLLVSRGSLEEQLAILAGEIPIPGLDEDDRDLRVFVENNVIGSLSWLLCIPEIHISTKRFDLSGSVLGSYLMDHSEWIEGLATYGLALESYTPGPLGESSEGLSSEQVEALWSELMAISVPGELDDEWKRLLRLVEPARKHENLTIVRVLM